MSMALVGMLFRCACKELTASLMRYTLANNHHAPCRSRPPDRLP